MNYWHLQMHQGLLSDKEITTEEVLKILKDELIIGTGHWDNYQCEQFVGTHHENNIKPSDIVLVRHGKNALALCKVLSDNYKTGIYYPNERKIAILELFGKTQIAPMQGQGTLSISYDQKSDTWKYINILYQNYLLMKNMDEILTLLKSKKQIILAGAPGTGKTYKTAEIALRIIDENNNKKVDYTSRESIMNAYKNAIEEKQIVFTTFHQSLDYEEFVEGIKPYKDQNDDKIMYDVIPGIFKRMCEHAIWKDSLKELENAIEDFKSECEENPEKDPLQLETREKGIFTVTYRGGITFRARSLKSNAPEGKDFPASIDNIIGLYTHDESGMYNKTYVWGILNYLKKKYNLPIYRPNEIKDKNYLLIIDEINRGNISKIFGELITLLEQDKRLGELNELKLRLPYSPDKEFGVPPNLYIIGTMNTADRSLGHIDYAVRRRFAFIYLKSDRDEIIKFYSEENKIVKEKALAIYDKVSLFINENISPDFNEKDLMLGHSYFMAKDEKDLDLKLKYEIKPLLLEYLKDGIFNHTIKENEIDQITI